MPPSVPKERLHVPFLRGARIPRNVAVPVRILQLVSHPKQMYLQETGVGMDWDAGLSALTRRYGSVTRLGKGLVSAFLLQRVYIRCNSVAIRCLWGRRRQGGRSSRRWTHQHYSLRKGPIVIQLLVTPPDPLPETPNACATTQ